MASEVQILLLPQWVVTEVANGVDCKSIGFRLHWFESNTAHIIKDKTKESD